MYTAVLLSVSTGRKATAAGGHRNKPHGIPLHFSLTHPFVSPETDLIPVLAEHRDGPLSSGDDRAAVYPIRAASRPHHQPNRPDRPDDHLLCQLDPVSRLAHQSLYTLGDSRFDR